jgi:hypothetical protein
LRRASKVSLLLLTLVAAACIVVPASRADIVLDTAFPTVKKQTRIHVTDDRNNPIPDAEITVTYRPGSAVERGGVIGCTGDDGNSMWTPAEAGIVTITATWTDTDRAEQSSSINSSVKFNPTPISGILIMIIAGVLLIGGSIERILSLLSTPHPD